MKGNITLSTVCARCGDSFGNHRGYKCPDGKENGFRPSQGEASSALEEMKREAIPIFFTPDEGAKVQEWPLDKLPPRGLAEHIDSIILGSRYSLVRNTRTGAMLRVHAILFDNGLRWDSYNGWEDTGSLPRFAPVKEYPPETFRTKVRLPRIDSVPIGFDWGNPMDESHSSKQLESFNNPLTALRDVLPDCYGHTEHEKWWAEQRRHEHSVQNLKEDEVEVRLADIEIGLYDHHFYDDHEPAAQVHSAEIQAYVAKYGKLPG